MKGRYTTLVLLVTAFIALFLARLWLASTIDVPRTFELLELLTAAGALLILLQGYRRLHPADWITALVLGAMVGAGMRFATLFSPYPFLGAVHDSAGQAWVRGGLTWLATLGGLVIMRQGGPVQFHLPNGQWRKALRGILVGLAVGLPLATLNVFALQATQGHPVHWQSLWSAMLDALQPAVVEEVIYRFALWGLLWLLLRRSLPDQAVWLAGLLSMLAHTYSHFDDLFLQSPLAALGMGAVLALFWGLPSLILARRRGLESAIAFHWLQDAARFWAGF